MVPKQPVFPLHACTHAQYSPQATLAISHESQVTRAHDKRQRSHTTGHTSDLPVPESQVTSHKTASAVSCDWSSVSASGQCHCPYPREQGTGSHFSGQQQRLTHKLNQITGQAATQCPLHPCQLSGAFQRPISEHCVLLLLIFEIRSPAIFEIVSAHPCIFIGLEDALDQLAVARRICKQDRGKHSSLHSRQFSAV